ncbi:hypothetical protein [Aquimarina hainanensis]|uniref:hypothetical protein n=1 Tax=Aquimarina hainanensis TaxID=1578017 RepID=UPI0036137622
MTSLIRCRIYASGSPFANMDYSSTLSCRNQLPAKGVIPYINGIIPSLLLLTHLG